MSKRLWLFISILIVVIVAALGLILWRHHEHSVAVRQQALRKDVKQVGVSASTKQPAAATTPEPAKTPTGTGAEQSNSTDTDGRVVATTEQSQWTTSTSGNLTLQQPVVGAMLKSGSVVSGTSKVAGPVSYRLSDNSVGVLTQGTLNVVNGKFSGTLNFTPVSSAGQLDVFTTNNQGFELDEIQIGVKF